MIRPLPSTLGVRADGTFCMVDTLGQSMPDDTKIVVTAGALAQHLANSAVRGVRLGMAHPQQRDIPDAAVVDAVGRVLQAAADAGVKAGAKAGVQAGAQYVLANSRVRRTVERDASGQIVGTIEVREPVP